MASWSDGKGKQHDILTGASPATYTATYTACTKRGTSAAETLIGNPGADVICGLGGTDTKVTDPTEKSIVGFP